jgi:tetrahydromethanopterin S-methyltransferase subunit G
LNYKNDKPSLITLSPKAYEALKEFADDIEPKLIDELAEISQFAGKLSGSILRIAGLLYIAERLPFTADELILDECFMRNAITIGEHFLEHAKAAYQLMGADEVTEQCKYILRQLSKTKPVAVTVRDIMRICQKFKTAESVIVPISRLCEYGYLRELSNEYSGTGRPQAKSWEINPMSYENL